MGKIKFSLLSIIWLAFLIYSKTPFLFPMLCAVILHELGHILIAIILKIKIKHLKLSVLGARIETEGALSYTDELLLALGGPLFGFLGYSFTISIALMNDQVPFCCEFLLPFSIISLCLTVFNLLPLETLDGGRIFKCLLLKLFSLNFADKIIRIASFFSLFLLWLFSVYFVIKISQGLQLLVFCMVFFSKCFVFDAKNRDF